MKERNENAVEHLLNAIDLLPAGEIRETARAYVRYLSSLGLTFYRDNNDCWRDKVYEWVMYDGECVCFLAVSDPDEPENLWTVWSEGGPEYADAPVSEEIRQSGWAHVDFCGSCGSCGGGQTRVIFGRAFENVCGCVFRLDNAVSADLPFLQAMTECRLRALGRMPTDGDSYIFPKEQREACFSRGSC